MISSVYAYKTVATILAFFASMDIFLSKGTNLLYSVLALFNISNIDIIIEIALKIIPIDEFIISLTSLIIISWDTILIKILK